MNTEPNNGPIISSRHHDTQPDYDTKSNAGKNPNANVLVLIVVAVLVIGMGLGMFFFLAVSDQPEEPLVAPIEAY